MSKIDDLLNSEKRALPHVKCYLTPEKHADFQKFCKSRGKSMSEVLNALVDDLLERERRKVAPISAVPRLLKGAEDEE